MVKLTRMDLYRMGLEESTVRKLKPAERSGNNQPYYYETCIEPEMITAWKHDPYVPYHNALALYGASNSSRSWIALWPELKRASRIIKGRRLYHHYRVKNILRKRGKGFFALDDLKIS